jgi:molybdopterin-guanine dinucleotide biosynthesis protein A
VDDVSIFVLAGGRSSRMGSDKAFLPIGDVNLLQLTLAKAKEVAPKTVIVGNRERYAQYGDVIEDIIPGCGPLSGIHAALSSTGSGLNLILSVDMPLMSSDFLRWLLQIGAACDDLAIVPQAQGRTQPLCSVFRRLAQNEVERALRAGEYKVDRLFSIVPTRLISESEWQAAGFPPDIFRNVNTPPEYDAVVTELEELPAESARSPHS